MFDASTALVARGEGAGRGPGRAGPRPLRRPHGL